MVLIIFFGLLGWVGKQVIDLYRFGIGSLEYQDLGVVGAQHNAIGLEYTTVCDIHTCNIDTVNNIIIVLEYILSICFPYITHALPMLYTGCDTRKLGYLYFICYNAGTSLCPL
jgi:hypothetical protein